MLYSNLHYHHLCQKREEKEKKQMQTGERLLDVSKNFIQPLLIRWLFQSEQFCFKYFFSQLCQTQQFQHNCLSIQILEKRKHMLLFKINH